MRNEVKHLTPTDQYPLITCQWCGEDDILYFNETVVDELEEAWDMIARYAA